ncbi:hypothetical protein [Patulibacter sp.]|uniref:hypothetical protein n=1 Tax=Patulibacter sp. TaxID=1912859 RepID=UPI002716A153|nr:hypothetical protein [Patulibacter sp.]MDO9408042.1 hypothetical protein [Patulibacter sp.]
MPTPVRPVTAAPPARGTRRRSSRLIATALVGVAAAGGTAAVLPSAATAADPGDLKRYYGIFDRGPAKIPGRDTSWTPQGLAYWPEQNALVISYYDSSGAQNSRLAVVDRTTGARRKLLVMPTKGHVGGLAMTGSYLWVANNGKLVRFSKAQLTKKAELATLKSNGSYAAAASSYLTATADALWVGTFSKAATGTSSVYRYPLDAKQRPSARPSSTVSTPTRVQGMAFGGGKVVWSRSYGRDSRSRIDVAPTSNPTQPSRIITAPKMSEGIVNDGSRFHVVYESASSTYADASYRVKTIHSAPVATLLGP